MALIQDPNDTYQPITLEAHDLVFGDREGSYGHPFDDFSCTAAMWTAYLKHLGVLAAGAEIRAEEVGPMMVCVKVARQANAPKRDNMVDCAGYAETTARVIAERKRRLDLIRESLLDAAAQAPSAEECSSMADTVGRHGHTAHHRLRMAKGQA